MGTVDGEERGNAEEWSTDVGGVADEFDAKRSRWSISTAVVAVSMRHFDC